MKLRQVILQNLTELRELYLDGVDISDHDTDWSYLISSSLPDLRSLSLRHCGISGPLHSSLLQLHSLSVIRLDNNNLWPTTPDFFANFSSLTTLTLSSCSLVGVFPEKIFEMPTLEYLDLSYNRNVSGSLPPSIGNLQMLSMIDLSWCQFTGTIPHTLGNLTRLTHLDLSGNSFTGSIPSLIMLKNLARIDLSSNNLTGSVSSADFEDKPSLAYLNLRNNLLNGSIPQSLFGAPSLVTLLLSFNNFSGSINEFSTLGSYNMYELDLSGNKLEGRIPESFFELQGLRYLSLSYNSFNGTVSFEKFQIPLLWLDLSYNNLSIDASNINSSMPVFAKLTTLGLASCNLRKIPILRNQSYLTNLVLSNNQMTGEIPSWIWEIGSGGLRRLDLSFNLLVDMPQPYHISPSLNQLDLHSNHLRGQFPSITFTLLYMDCSDNNFEGFLEAHFMRNLSWNSQFLSLANNRLRGTVPPSLCHATNLLMLDLSNNQLTGNIPPCLLEDLDNLKFLKLGRNNISGNIPDSFSSNCSLNTMDLQKNNLQGKIPTSLSNCKKLEVMNVGDNHIEDTFPCMLPSNIRVLVLHSNKFHGEVSCHRSWPNIQIMDIASNNFSGYLYPLNFGSWSRMLQDNDALLRPLDVEIWINLNNVNEVALTFKGQERVLLVKSSFTYSSIDFSCNNFQGEIPDAVGDLKGLYILNFSHNALTGTIPESFGNLTRLESLDLSSNMLSGKIPRELAGLTFLSAINLSYNKLIGEIPPGHQFQTFSASSFQGNAGLCGFPLDKTCSKTDQNGAGGTTGQSYEKKEIEWGYVSAALGFGVGFGSAVTLVFGFDPFRSICSEKAEQIFEYIFVNQQNRRRGRRRMQTNQVRRP